MAAKSGKKFCAEHGAVEAEQNDMPRTPCPYDPKHTCYINKLSKHMRKCNSRPKEMPPYIKPSVNTTDEAYINAEDDIYPINSIPNQYLLELVEKIEKVYADEGLNARESFLTHEVVKDKLDDPQLGMNTKKHLIQNSSLLKNMENNGFFNGKPTFIEFGAGKGQLGFWIAQTAWNNENCSLLLIDRASHRHKSDNKLKGVSPVRSLRLRADIADVDLSKIPFLTATGNQIYGTAKHLCGIATDLALRCLVRAKSNGLNVRGLTVAFCCHHRCTWKSFVGKKYLTDVGFSPNQFSALCSISSWATCGSGKPREKMKTEDSKGENDRYGALGLSQERRENVGRKCKMILNQARLLYIKEFGFEGELLYYVKPNVSPENVCLIAKCS